MCLPLPPAGSWAAPSGPGGAGPGGRLPGRQLRDLLAPLGFVGGRRTGALWCEVPGYRSWDIRREIDLIEEVARTWGYDRFPDDLSPFRPGTVPDHPLLQLQDGLRQLDGGPWGSWRPRPWPSPPLPRERWRS
jgi:hypothetical protein